MDFGPGTNNICIDKMNDEYELTTIGIRRIYGILWFISKLPSHSAMKLIKKSPGLMKKSKAFKYVDHKVSPRVNNKNRKRI